MGEAEPHLLYRHARQPAISPDGRMIAFRSREFGKSHQEVWVGDVNGEAPRKLVDAEEFQDVFTVGLDKTAQIKHGLWEVR